MGPKRRHEGWTPLEARTGPGAGAQLRSPPVQGRQLRLRPVSELPVATLVPTAWRRVAWGCWSRESVQLERVRQAAPTCARHQCADVSKPTPAPFPGAAGSAASAFMPMALSSSGKSLETSRVETCEDVAFEVRRLRSEDAADSLVRAPWTPRSSQGSEEGPRHGHRRTRGR